MAIYIPHSIFHLARLLYVRPDTFGPYYVYVGRRQRLNTVVSYGEVAGSIPVFRLVGSYGDNICVQTVPDLRSGFLPEEPTQHEFCANWNLGVCIQEGPLEIRTAAHWKRDRPQHGRPAIYVIAQQYSPVTFV